MRASYPTYKSTSIPWLPQMPEHWDALKAKHIFKERSEKGYPDEPLLAATQTKGVVRKEEYETRTVTAQKDFHLLKLVKEEDFVISLRSFQGGIEYAYHRGIISPAYTIFYERNKVPVNKAFYRHLFKSHPFINSLTLFVTGIREGQNIDYAEFKDSLLPFPPLPEQTAIANYLDAKTEQINRFIAKKEKLIVLLKEQKQAVINELLEDKEGKWERRKLRHAIKGKLKYGANESGIPYNPEYPRYIRITDFGSDGKLRNDDMLSLLPSVAKDYILKDGDILFARSGGTVGKTFQYKKSDADASLSCYAGYLIKAEPNEKVILSDFLYIYTLSGYYEQWKQGIFNKATIENIGADKYSQLLIPVPPIETQKLILSNINSETTKIDDAILRIEREIEKVKELKQSLIAEVVTGKIKVA
ncbi:MAG: restriction endonuclease subunit S [Bacteroidetes bacterium]|nr:restriction endonuclease subunit S [Bacteroidota bacterium]